MKVVVLLLIVIAVFSLASWCIAQDRDGKKLLVECEAALAVAQGRTQSLDADKYFGAGSCLGLMHGILAMNTFYVSNTQKGRILFCAPDGVTSGQAARIVIKYLRDHPEELHQPDYALTIAALHAAFPCTNKK